MSKVRRKVEFVVIALLLVLLSSCITRPATRDYYYTLDYLARTERNNLVRQEPFPATVHVTDSRVARAYTRPQLVQRGLGPEFEYLDDRLWGIDLSETVSVLIDRRVSAYGIFSRTFREFTRQSADYELRSEIGSIEYVSYEGTSEAVLEIELSLWQLPDSIPVVEHRARAVESIYGEDVAIFVSAVNEMLLGEVDRFLEDVTRYFETGESRLDDETPSGAAAVGESEARGDTASDESADDAEPGRGVLLLPALADSENQPFYTILGSGGEFVQSARFGEPTSLLEGEYTVLLGSGPEDQRMRLDEVTVIARQRTVVEPVWAAMTVTVIDENREPVRLRYDIYDAETGQSYGGRIYRAEQLISSQTVWILDAARYKVVILNRPFNTLRDFVTVNLRPGRSEDLTIVVSTDEAGNVTSMLGAGNVDLEEVTDVADPLSIASSITGSFSFTANDEDAPGDFETVYFLDSEIETELVYELGPLRYELENNMAMGFNAFEQRPLRVASDEFRLRNTLLYGLTDLFGFYARADARATIVGSRTVFDAPTDYAKLEDGNVVEQQQDAEFVQLSPPFLPLSLREGLGINVNALRRQSSELGLRGGIGATQMIRFRTYEPSGTITIDGETYQAYEPAATQVGTGLELSASATQLLPLNASLTSIAEVFVPFRAGDPVSLQWENVVTVVLVNNLSLYYRFVLASAVDEEGDPYLAQDHGVFVRLNYLFR
ncbi:MAG: hypothetical protein ACOC2N_03980 [Spirochaetota bacterium]